MARIPPRNIRSTFIAKRLAGHVLSWRPGATLPGPTYWRRPPTVQFLEISERTEHSRQARRPRSGWTWRRLTSRQSRGTQILKILDRVLKPFFQADLRFPAP